MIETISVCSIYGAETLLTTATETRDGVKFTLVHYKDYEAFPTLYREDLDGTEIACDGALPFGDAPEKILEYFLRENLEGFKRRALERRL